MRSALLCLAILFVAMTSSAAKNFAVDTLPLPNRISGIGFDDMSFAPTLRKVLVPAGRSGNLDLVDPYTGQVTAIGGFSHRTTFMGGHDSGVTSADEGRGFLFATDRDTMQLDVIDPRSRAVVARIPLVFIPDYVRFVAATGEVWVTEPDSSRIETFSLPENTVPKPVHVGFIAIPGGPESLLIDNKRGRAYTNRWTDTTLAIELKTRRMVSRWKNGCNGSRGIAMDDAKGLLLVACEEERLEVLDLATGARLGHVSTGAGVDIIAYNPVWLMPMCQDLRALLYQSWEFPRKVERSYSELSQLQGAHTVSRPTIAEMFPPTPNARAVSSRSCWPAERPMKQPPPPRRRDPDPTLN